jgi:hypothetical protein
MDNTQLLDSIKKALGDSTNGLQKTITTSTGLVNFDLQAPAKNLYPVITPIRNRLPRVQGRGGIATNWRQVSAIVGSGVKSMPWVPEGQRSGRMSYVTANKSAPYVTLGEEDTVTEEAINAAAGFEDVQSTMTMRLLQQTMIKEESAIIGGNASLALGTPATPTASFTAGSATLPSLTYSVIVVALTLEGYLAASLATGVVQAQAIVGADGKSYTVNGGSSNKSAAASQAITLGQVLGASTPVVNGAVAYAWYVGASGSEKLEAITTINSVSFSAPLIGGAQQPATAITVDASRNASLAFDGIFSTAFTSGTAYIKNMATGVSGAGTPLTVGNRRNVVEIDAMLKSMWDNYRLSPTVIYVNSQELQNITNKVMNNTSNPIYYAADQGNPYAVVANGVVTGYFNPFTTAGNNVVIPIMLHPNIPAGTILSWCENLPAQYQSNEVPNVAEMHVRKDYVQTFWPQVTRSRDTGVYVEEGFACYAPFGIGMICNIGNG